MIDDFSVKYNWIFKFFWKLISWNLHKQHLLDWHKMDLLVDKDRKRYQQDMPEKVRKVVIGTRIYNNCNRNYSIISYKWEFITSCCAIVVKLSTGFIKKESLFSRRTYEFRTILWLRLRYTYTFTGPRKQLFAMDHTCNVFKGERSKHWPKPACVTKNII